MKLKRLFALLLTFALLAAVLPAAAAATVERVTVTGAPEVLALDEVLPTTGLTVQGAHLAADAMWFASSDGKDTALQKPLAPGATAAAGKFYYLGLLLAADGEFSETLTTTVNGAPANVQRLDDGKIFVTVRYDRRSHRLDGLGAVKYSDVADNAWYAPEVAEATQLGLVNGVSATQFAPEATASRAMLITILYRAQGSPAAAAPDFSDVPAGSWFTDAVGWGAKREIVLGFEDDTFRPDAAVTREQVAAILYRYASFCGYDTAARTPLERFDDAENVSDWAAEAVQWAVASGLLNGDRTGGRLLLQPQGSATRAQIAALLCRLLRAYPEDTGSTLPEYHTLRGLTVGYIPLDNRPVNNVRPEWLAESAGLTLRMPEESLYATRLDGQTPNPNGTTYGDREGLLAWLRENEAHCDAFVLSLDQLLSGGLVSSRALDNDDLTFEYSVIDYLAELAARKPVYVFDTVMRLASTVDYNGLGLAEYHRLRAYGGKARAELTGDALTVENIISGYRYDPDGVEIATDLPAEALDRYLAARARKLRLGDYLLRHAENFRTVVVGVDDSVPRASIQSNEIAYLTGLLGENCTLFCAADELGMMGLARLYADLLPRRMRANVLYFGGGEDDYADSFDTATLRETVQLHMAELHIDEATGDGDADVLILTRGASQDDEAAFLNVWRNNAKTGRFTILLDTSGGKFWSGSTVYAINTVYTLGYSSWGTAANALGLGLSMGLVRWGWLRYETNTTTADNDAFAKTIAFAFVKDLAYYRGTRGSIKDLSPYGIYSALKSNDLTQLILDRLNGNVLLRSLVWERDDYRIPTLYLTDFSAPFARAYEVRFDFAFNTEPTPPEPEPDPEPTEPTEPPTEPPTEAPSEPPTEAPTEAPTEPTTPPSEAPTPTE